MQLRRGMMIAMYPTVADGYQAESNDEIREGSIVTDTVGLMVSNWEEALSAIFHMIMN